MYVYYLIPHVLLLLLPSKPLSLLLLAPLLQVLTSLSSGEKGARSMYLQLRADQRFSMLNWKRMFKLLMLVVQRYEPEEGKEHANGGTGSAPAGSSQRRSLSEQVLPACDSSALCAYLNLFR